MYVNQAYTHGNSPMNTSSREHRKTAKAKAASERGSSARSPKKPITAMKGSPKDARVGLRLRPEHKELFEMAATLRGSSMTDFLVASAVEKAERIISDASATSLCLEAARHFAEALQNPPEPNERMRAAATRYRELLSA